MATGGHLPWALGSIMRTTSYGAEARFYCRIVHLSDLNSEDHALTCLEGRSLPSNVCVLGQPRRLQRPTARPSQCPFMELAPKHPAVRRSNHSPACDSSVRSVQFCTCNISYGQALDRGYYGFELGPAEPNRGGALALGPLIGSYPRPTSALPTAMARP